HSTAVGRKPAGTRPFGLLARAARIASPTTHPPLAHAPCGLGGGLEGPALGITPGSESGRGGRISGDAEFEGSSRGARRRPCTPRSTGLLPPGGTPFDAFFGVFRRVPNRSSREGSADQALVEATHPLEQNCLGA